MATTSLTSPAQQAKEDALFDLRLYLQPGALVYVSSLNVRGDKYMYQVLFPFINKKREADIVNLTSLVTTVLGETLVKGKKAFTSTSTPAQLILDLGTLLFPTGFQVPTGVSLSRTTGTEASPFEPCGGYALRHLCF